MNRRPFLSNASALLAVAAAGTVSAHPPVPRAEPYRERRAHPLGMYGGFYGIPHEGLRFISHRELNGPVGTRHPERRAACKERHARKMRRRKRRGW